MRDLTLHEKITIRGILERRGVPARLTIQMGLAGALYHWQIQFGYWSLSNYGKIISRKWLTS